MPFKCALCELDIQVGEPMLADEKMNLAHEVCVKKGKSIDPPSAIVVQAKVGGPGFGNKTAIIEPCLLPSAPKVCAECQKTAISMCPHCKVYVHQNYGYDGGIACSTIHEGKCHGARTSRELTKKPLLLKPDPVFDTAMKITPMNGKPRKERGRR